MPNVKKIRGLNLSGTPWATSACCGMTFTFTNLRTKSNYFSLFIYKALLGRPRRRREDNIKMDLREVGGGGGDWMELAQDRNRWRALVGTVRNLRVPKLRGIS